MLDPISVISFDLIDEYFKDTCITERKWISYMKSNYNNISFLTNNIKIIKIKKGPKTNMSNYKITSDLSKKSIIENNNNIIFIIFNICRYSKNVCHANLLIIDKYKNEIYRFEPHGSESHYYVSKLIDSKIKKIMCPDFKYIGPANYQDISGPQDISENIENFEPIFSGF